VLLACSVVFGLRLDEFSALLSLAPTNRVVLEAHAPGVLLKF